jgi:hypothetical protein
MQSLGVYAKSNTAQGGGINFEQYFTGIFLNSISFAKASGTIVYKQDVPTVGLNYRDNTQLDWKALVPSGTVEIEDKSFSFNDMKVTIAEITIIKFRIICARNRSRLTSGIRLT